MSNHDALGDRMKGYELASKTRLPKRLPVVLRVDGKAFHTWTQGLAAPFDLGFVEAMNLVMLKLCKEVEGAVFGYVQSDEISILLHNYKRLQTMPWFDNEVQKMTSVAASIASSSLTLSSGSLFNGSYKPAHFDARVFIVPEAEVVNYFLWRQQDASRNSIQMLAGTLYSHKELHQKNTSALNELCFAKGHNWNDLPTAQRRGRGAYRIEEMVDGVVRHKWIIDNEIPLFNHDRAYIEKHLAVVAEDKPEGG